jgi:hypothetical protein
MDTTIAETEKLLQAIEGARMQFSSAADELRYITTATRERLRWLIAELDKLRVDLKKVTMPGDLE